jgi:CcmD family protein
MTPQVAQQFETVSRVIGDQWPLVVGAYGLIWVVLFGFMVFVYTRLSRVEKEIAVIEGTVKRREKLEAAEAAEAAEKPGKPIDVKPAS